MTRHFLTTRLVGEVLRVENYSLPDIHTLRRRLRILEQANLIARERTSFDSQHYYYLSHIGLRLVEAEYGIDVSGKARSKMGIAIQNHEHDLSRFWIKFFDDSHKIRVPLIHYWRDGQFSAEALERHLIPDGIALLRIRGKIHAFALELDRSTQTSGVSGKGIFRRKLEQYRVFLRTFRHHPDLQEVCSLKLMVVCKTEKRMTNLRQIAADLRVPCLFICWSRLVDVGDKRNAQSWNFTTANLLATPHFYLPSRSPPQSLLSPIPFNIF